MVMKEEGVGKSGLVNSRVKSLPPKLLQKLKNWIGIEKFKAALDGHCKVVNHLIYVHCPRSVMLRVRQMRNKASAI